MKTVWSHIQRSINQRLYSYYASKVKRPELFTRQQLCEEGYASQFGQDKWVIEELLPNQRNGTFIDVGANDGITFSNTFFLEALGWNGIAVEPIKSAYKKLTQNRRCITVYGCIAPRTGKNKFRAVSGYSEMLSGLVDEYDPRHLQRIHKEIELHGGEYEDIEVDCYNFNELLQNHNITRVDYLSIDIEGAELKILKSIDFSRTKIKLIGIENNYKDYRIPRFLKKHGYEFHSVLGDEFYVSNQVVKEVKN